MDACKLCNQNHQTQLASSIVRLLRALQPGPSVELIQPCEHQRPLVPEVGVENLMTLPSCQSGVVLARVVVQLPIRRSDVGHELPSCPAPSAPASTSLPKSNLAYAKILKPIWRGCKWGIATVVLWVCLFGHPRILFVELPCLAVHGLINGFGSTSHDCRGPQ
jgi:hypothetical protein